MLRSKGALNRVHAVGKLGDRLGCVGKSFGQHTAVVAFYVYGRRQIHLFRKLGIKTVGQKKKNSTGNSGFGNCKICLESGIYHRTDGNTADKADSGKIFAFA